METVRVWWWVRWERGGGGKREKIINMTRYSASRERERPLVVGAACLDICKRASRERERERNALGIPKSK